MRLCTPPGVSIAGHRGRLKVRLRHWYQVVVALAEVTGKDFAAGIFTRHIYGKEPFDYEPLPARAGFCCVLRSRRRRHQSDAAWIAPVPGRGGPRRPHQARSRGTRRQTRNASGTGRTVRLCDGALRNGRAECNRRDEEISRGSARFESDPSYDGTTLQLTMNAAEALPRATSPAADRKSNRKFWAPPPTFFMSAALKFTGMSWDVHGRYHILQQLVEGFGSDGDHNQFPKR